MKHNVSKIALTVCPLSDKIPDNKQKQLCLGNVVRAAAIFLVPRCCRAVFVMRADKYLCNLFILQTARSPLHSGPLSFWSDTWQ